MAAIYRRRRHAELNPQVSTQGCNTSGSYTLIYAHDHTLMAEQYIELYVYRQISYRQLLLDQLFD